MANFAVPELSQRWHTGDTSISLQPVQRVQAEITELCVSHKACHTQQMQKKEIATGKAI